MSRQVKVCPRLCHFGRRIHANGRLHRRLARRPSPRNRHPRRHGCRQGRNSVACRATVPAQPSNEASMFRKFLLIAAVLLTPACEVSQTGVAEPCAAGALCECAGFGACTRECTGTGCDFRCSGSGACTFLCPSGKCKATGAGVGATELSCSGNGCQLACTGAGACELTGCNQNCKVSCSGSGECSNSCNHPTCSP